MDHKKLKRSLNAARQGREEHRFWEDIEYAFDKKELVPSDFSIRELFYGFVEDGRELVDSWGRGRKYVPGSGVKLYEASDAVNTGDFSNISGQIVYNAIMEAFKSEAYVFSLLIPTQQTEFNGEKIAGITRLGDQALIVPEGTEFPFVGISETWINTPVTVKRGMILPMTKEAIFFDRTGLILSRGAEVGTFLGLNKEKRAIDVVIDENTTAHRHSERDTVRATYQTTTPWDNVTASNPLDDWTAIDAANQTLNGIVDPDTGEPVEITATTLICTKQLELTANRIKNATEVRLQKGGFATSGDLEATTVSGNMVGTFEIVTSRLLAARAATDTTWLWGDPRKAFRYFENFPLTTEQATGNSHDEFHRDIAMQWKTSERGAYATMEPRVMIENTA